jgi:hypothetical protein
VLDDRGVHGIAVPERVAKRVLGNAVERVMMKLGLAF